MKNKHFLLSFCLTVLTMVSCTLDTCEQTTDVQLQFEDIITSDDVNQTIVLSAPDGWNEYLLGAQVELAVWLKSEEHTIILETDNVRIFEVTDDGFLPIENDTSYAGHITYIIEPVGIPAFRLANIVATPQLDRRSSPVTLRFVVTANYYDDEIIGKKVFAYTDVTLQP